jgi:hypothetical protein
MCAAFVVLGIVVIAIVVYLNLSLMMGVVRFEDGSALCLRLPSHEIKQALSKLDLAFNLMLPYSIIFIATILNVHHYRGLWAKGQDCTEGFLVSPGHPSPNGDGARSTTVSHQSLRNLKTDRELTRLVIVVASSFLVFSLPCHAFRAVILLLGSIWGEQALMSPNIFHWQQLLLYVFFSRPALNLFVAIVSSAQIRRALRPRCFPKDTDDSCLEMDEAASPGAQCV